MERRGLTHDRAFGFLVRLSQDSNIKSRDIAGDMVDEQDKQAAARASMPSPSSVQA